MRKIISLIMATLLTVSMGLASACQYDAPKSIIGAQLNDKGELILTYSDNTTQNLGVVKGEDGKDGENGLNGKDGIDGVDGTNGKDGVDLTACEHSYNDWEVQLSPTCTSIGYNTRTCSLCGDLEYQFTEAFGHTYKNPVDVVNTYEQHLVSKTCSTCGDTTLKDAPIEHHYDKSGVCTACGETTDFIENEEYIEVRGVAGEKGVYSIVWWNIDRTWGVRIGRTISYNTQLEEYNWASDWVFKGFAGTPIHATLPESYQGQPLTSLGTVAGGAFAWTPSLESIIIPKTVTYIGPWSFQGCTSLTSVFLEGNPRFERLPLTECDAILYRYSENEPTEEGNYWHYVDGKPVIWEI